MVKARMVLVGMFAACSALSSCTSSPTYGTDKTSMEQLVEDVGSAASIGSKKKTTDTAYNPRPDLVLPPKGETAQLVQPQQSLASKDNPEWVESPEDTRTRLVAEADANRGNQSYRSPLLEGNGTNGTMTETQKWQAFRDARKLQKGAYIDQRRVLSDPPASYREVDQAKLDDLGEPEAKKEKRRQKEAEMSNSNKSWWMPFQ
ncbi:hypothetical protein [Agrobacterium vitis]|uniref:hypothetical protein n=1 Tax=Agrobacterium vitis TaxID=373 RepID=UPI001D60FCA5|nr:hypothetical protein [Agrobacterium vitis]NSZ19042.1 hypothetical protein [Agrobacterium vitis]